MEPWSRALRLVSPQRGTAQKMERGAQNQGAQAKNTLWFHTPSLQLFCASV